MQKFFGFFSQVFMNFLKKENEFQEISDEKLAGIWTYVYGQDFIAINF